MFPPERTDDPYQLLQNVLGSVARAGSVFRQDVLVAPEEQDLRVTIGLNDRIPPNGEKPLKDYMHMYATLSGWRISGMQFRKRYVRFSLKKAA